MKYSSSSVITQTLSTLKKKVSELIRYKGKSLHAGTEEAAHKQVLEHSICLPAIPQR